MAGPGMALTQLRLGLALADDAGIVSPLYAELDLNQPCGLGNIGLESRRPTPGG